MVPSHVPFSCTRERLKIYQTMPGIFDQITLLNMLKWAYLNPGKPVMSWFTQVYLGKPTTTTTIKKPKKSKSPRGELISSQRAKETQQEGKSSTKAIISTRK
ncbi:hypothetical protein I7I53_05878 [Histoplasma capsulatum var. duboisii H88]|uniref:Uncharacterized protein n=1 Tax=Ajellomyces capsulatus (strain H88) TaxID=544711 RepID=A0A8A1LAR6_AJEC8|nr:hypothetical protein I7I53_05878 [Histoplasma capsulatum var. duboisii H88]